MAYCFVSGGAARRPGVGQSEIVITLSLNTAEFPFVMAGGRGKEMKPRHRFPQAATTS